MLTPLLKSTPSAALAAQLSPWFASPVLSQGPGLDCSLCMECPSPDTFISSLALLTCHPAREAPPPHNRPFCWDPLPTPVSSRAQRRTSPQRVPVRADHTPRKHCRGQDSHPSRLLGAHSPRPTAGVSTELMLSRSEAHAPMAVTV